MQYVKQQGSGGDKGGRFKSDAAEFLTHLILKLNNTATPAGSSSVETLTSDHGGKVLSNEFRKWLKMHGVFHLTAPRHEPNYNSIIERSSAVMENMAFAMIHHANKPKSWWNYAFDWAVHMCWTDAPENRMFKASLHPRHSLK